MPHIGRRYPLQPLLVHRHFAASGAVSGVVAGALDPIVGAGTAVLLAAGVVAGQMAPIVGAGTAVLLGAGVLAGSFGPIVGAGTAAAQDRATVAGALDPIVGAGTATLLARAVLGGALDPIVGAGTAGIPVHGGDFTATLDAIVGAGTAVLLAKGVLGGTLAAIVGAGTATAPLAGIHAIFAVTLSPIVAHLNSGIRGLSTFVERGNLGSLRGGKTAGVAFVPIDTGPASAWEECTDVLKGSLRTGQGL